MLKNRNLQGTICLLACLMSGAPVHASEAEDYFSKAQQAHRKGRVGQAERYYYRAFMADSGLVEAAAALADLYYVQGRMEEASSILDRALENHPDNGQLWARKGLLYRAAGEMDKAREAYEQAIAASPDDPVILERAAGFYKLIGDAATAEALSQARRALLEARKK